MANGNQIINYAKKFVGEHSNRFTDAYGVSRSTAWCVIFVWYVLTHCGYKFPHVCWVPHAEQFLQKNAEFVPMA